MAITIDNTRMPEDIERGASGGPNWSTTVTETDNGRDTTNQNWDYPLRIFDVSYPIQERDNIDDVINFFNARRGRAYGFRFKDWSDFTVTTGAIGTGDGVETDFQLVKVYPDDVRPLTLPITRPVDGTLLVYVNGALQTEGGGDDYTVDYNTGIVTFNSAPTDTHPITATFEYDIPARFDTDGLNLTIDFYDAISAGSLIVKEVRES